MTDNDGDSVRGAEAAEVDFAALTVDPGLCSTCRHGGVVRSSRAAYLRCGLSDSDPRYRRYPPLPVLVCEGYEDRAIGTPQKP